MTQQYFLRCKSVQVLEIKELSRCSAYAMKEENCVAFG